MKNNKTKKFNMTTLFRNNKFLLLFSFVTACIIWLFFSQNTQEDLTTTIHDIPISIELSQEAKDDGLQVVSGADTLASVRVSGNRLTIGNITKSDIQVVADQAITTITAPNTYTLELVAKQSGVKSNYEILSVTPTTVTVVVDRIREKEIAITDNIDYTYTVDDQYYAVKPVLSNDKIVIKGPQSEVDEVESATIEGVFTGDLNKTTTADYTVKLYDEDGEEVVSPNITTDIENNDITVSINILSKKELPVTVTFNNVPEGINALDLVSVDPKTVMIAGPEETLDKLENISLSAIDFNSITPKTSLIEIPIELPSDCININNINNATVTFNFSGYDSTRLEIDNFKVTNIENGLSAKVTTSSVYVDIMGPSEDIANIKSGNVKAVIDLRDKKAVGTIEMPFTVEISDISNCWSYNVANNTVTVSVMQDEE